MLLRHHITFRKSSFIPQSCLRSRTTHHHNVFIFSFTNIAHIGTCLLLFFIDPAFGLDVEDEKKTVHLMSEDSSHTVAITLGVTIPCALIVGILWCYCMSKVCKTDQASLARPKLSRAHTASRELTSPPRTPKSSRYMEDDLPCHYDTQVPLPPHYDIEAQHQYDNDSFNEIPIHRYHSDSLEEVSGIPIEGGVHMDSFDSEEDVRDIRGDIRSDTRGARDAHRDVPSMRDVRESHPPPPIHKYDSDTSEDLPPVHRPKCKSLDDIRKKHRRKVPTCVSEPRMAPKRTAQRYNYDSDSISSDPHDSDTDDSDVIPERHKVQVLRDTELP